MPEYHYYKAHDRFKEEFLSRLPKRIGQLLEKFSIEHPDAIAKMGIGDAILLFFTKDGTFVRSTGPLTHQGLTPITETEMPVIEEDPDDDEPEDEEEYNGN